MDMHTHAHCVLCKWKICRFNFWGLIIHVNCKNWTPLAYLIIIYCINPCMYMYFVSGWLLWWLGSSEEWRGWCTHRSLPRWPSIRRCLCHLWRRGSLGRGAEVEQVKHWDTLRGAVQELCEGVSAGKWQCCCACVCVCLCVCVCERERERERERVSRGMVNILHHRP